MDAPYQWTKQVASHWGGTRNGLVVHWPRGIQSKGEVRVQFHHVIDVAPTVLEAAGLPQPVMVNGVMQKPLEGVSMAYSFDDREAAERHETQYFEMFVNRGIYHKAGLRSPGTASRGPRLAACTSELTTTTPGSCTTRTPTGRRRTTSPRNCRRSSASCSASSCAYRRAPARRASRDVARVGHGSVGASHCSRWDLPACLQPATRRATPQAGGRPWCGRHAARRRAA